MEVGKMNKTVSNGVDTSKKAKTQAEKLNQRQYFFWYKKENKAGIIQSLNRLKRPDLIKKLSKSV